MFLINEMLSLCFIVSKQSSQKLSISFFLFIIFNLKQIFNLKIIKTKINFKYNKSKFYIFFDFFVLVFISIKCSFSDSESFKLSSSMFPSSSNF